MKTTNLNATNLSGLSPELINEVESILGVEIESVYTYKKGFKKDFMIGKGFPIHSTFTRMRHFSKTNRIISFDDKTLILTLMGRNKWQRGETCVQFKLEVVGYKLNTTNIGAGYIYGNPLLITIN